MSSSFSYSETETFTVTHARKLASKVATDLKRMQRFYGSPSDTSIADYEAEIVALMKAGYFKSVSYGYRRDGNWIEPSLHYNANDALALTSADDDPGGIMPGADVAGATFYSYLTYTAEWGRLNSCEQESFKGNLPFQRTGAEEPGVSGYMERDRTYSAGGQNLARSTVRSF
jgi:hypothetical protein